MPQKVLIVKFKYENRVSFEVTEDDGVETKSIIKCEENGNIAGLWANITAVVSKFVADKMYEIGNEMRKP